MLKPISNPNSLLACCADCPADNHARQLALFLYETLAASKKIEFENKFRLHRKIKILQSLFDFYIYWSLVSDFRNRKF